MFRSLIFLMCLISSLSIFTISGAYAGGSEPPKNIIVTPIVLESAVTLMCELRSSSNKIKVILTSDKISIFYEHGVLEITSFKSILETRIWGNDSQAQWYRINAPMSTAPVGLTNFTIRLEKPIRPDATVMPVEYLSGETELFTSINWESAECIL